MSNFTDFIGGGGGTLFTIPVTKSTTWTPPFDGTAVIHCIGAGGSGSSNINANEEAGGGGAGGYSRKVVTLSTGTNWTMVVGAGGASVGRNNNGNAGGNTTATDGSSSLAGNGGGGGVKGSSPTAGAGGTASGGDINNTGGAGGTGSLNGKKMNGGGAVGILGTGNSGPSITASHGHYVQIYYGADSDVQSPQFENTNGELRGGGRGGVFAWNQGPNAQAQRPHGGFLAGGGAAMVDSTQGATYLVIKAGDGGIGGGGGSADNYNVGEVECSAGAGGAGLIIVMYTAIG